MLKNLIFIFLSLSSLSSLAADSNDAQSSERQEVIYIVYNADPKNDVSFSDSYHGFEGMEKLKDWMHDIAPHVSVDYLALDSMYNLSESVQKKLGHNILRGLVFVGHGNSDVYAFSKKEIFSGDKKIIDILTETIEATNSAKEFLIYFSGCSTGSRAGSFHNSLAISLHRYLSSQSTIKTKQLPDEIDLVAHETSTDPTKGVQLARPFQFDRFLIRSKIAVSVEKFSSYPAKFIGAYGPTLTNIFVVISTAVVAKLSGHADWAPAGFLLVLILKHIASTASMMAAKANISAIRSETTRDFAHSLITDSIFKRCEIILVDR